ncbi:uncharacterized protein LOC133534141 [Cydia pomonella]|uniref:uncharacterized protein LOC133534141 n=1 Tax=Cydia pomonella TaxID=82600 RepID=UPI002ADD9FB5|nr:uncharacterized protein LOC133534141 [Cydia pomonella]
MTTTGPNVNHKTGNQPDTTTETDIGNLAAFLQRLQPQQQRQPRPQQQPLPQPQPQTLPLSQSQQPLQESQTQTLTQTQTGKTKAKSSKKLKIENQIEIGAYASEVVDIDTFFSVVGHLARFTNKAVNEEKSVNRANKDAITRASLEITLALDKMRHIMRYDIQPSKVREIRQVIEDARSPPPTRSQSRLSAAVISPARTESVEGHGRMNGTGDTEFLHGINQKLDELPKTKELARIIKETIRHELDEIKDHLQKLPARAEIGEQKRLKDLVDKEDESKETDDGDFVEVVSKNARKKARALAKVQNRTDTSAALPAVATQMTPPKTTKGERNTNNTVNTSYAVVLESLDPRKESKEALQEVQEKVDLVELGVGIKGLRHTKTNKVVIQCETEEDRVVLSTAIKNKTTGVTVGVPQLRNPCVKIIGVIKDNAGERSVDALVKQNPKIMTGIREEDRQIRHIRSVKGRNDLLRNVVVEVSPQLYNRLIEQKVKIGYQSVPVVDQSPVMQCYNCMGYGHRAANCTASSKCGRCAEEHATRNCPKASSAECCTNCRGSDGDHSHPAYSQDCPEWIKWDRLARMSIRYC